MRLPFLACAALCCLVHLLSYAWLPDPMAIHFGFDGSANNWSSTTWGVGLMLGLTLFLADLFWFIPGAIAKLPNSLINLPHKDYWLAAEHRQDSLLVLRRYVSGYGCLVMILVAVLQILLVIANRQDPAHLSQPAIYLVLGTYLTATLVWVLCLTRHFRQHPERSATS